MLRVFLDLEMNMVSEKHTELRAQLPHEIIEIGAVKLDENCRVVDRFRSYVRPRYNHMVHWGVAKLTGITAKMLRGADYLEEVLPRFVAWLGQEESIYLYAWSDSDRAQWQRECDYKNLWTPQLRAACAHWTDFQRVFSRLLGYRNGLALGRAIEYMGLDFDGTKHDALSDAENCARLMALVLDEEEFARRKALAPPEPPPVRRPRQPGAKAATAPEGTTPNGDTPSGADAGAPPENAAAQKTEATPTRRRHRAGRRRHRPLAPPASAATELSQAAGSPQAAAPLQVAAPPPPQKNEKE